MGELSGGLSGASPPPFRLAAGSVAGSAASSVAGSGGALGGGPLGSGSLAANLSSSLIASECVECGGGVREGWAAACPAA
jgi:hypothetical protein